MPTMQLYTILKTRQRRLKAIKAELIGYGCSVKTIEAINHELDKVQNKINDLVWW